MQAEKLTSPPPPVHQSALLAAEQQLIAAEEQLLKDGRQWLSRAADLYTQTSKIKIWVPVAGSLLMTGYYLFTMHQSAAHANAVAPPPEVTESTPVAASPVAVAETSPLPKAPPFSAHASSSLTAGSTDGARVDSPAFNDEDRDDPKHLQDEDGPALQKRALQAHTNQQFALEAKLLQQMADQSGYGPAACPALGKAYERASQLEAAVQAFDQCVSADPNNIDGVVALAHALQTKRDFKRAQVLYRQSLLKDPTNIDAQTGLAQLQLNQNHLQEAGQSVQAILRRSPANTDALLIAGIVAWRESRLADAERVFQKGVSLDDRRADFHAFLGRIAEAERRPTDALRQYARALELDPSDSDIASRRDRLKNPQ